MLRSFELVSEIRVKFSKTKIGGVGLNNSLIQNFSNILNSITWKYPLSTLDCQYGESKEKIVLETYGF